MLEACMEKAAKTLSPNELEFEMLEEEEVVMPVAKGGYDAINAVLGPEGRSDRSAKAAETLGPEGCSDRAAKAAETLGPEGCSDRAAKAWNGGKRQTVVEAETPREDGSCAICGDRETIRWGTCQRCYTQKYRKRG
ncbi:hypothetical protein HYH02_003591 [Chlamydomonas schloesseri]|uniref:Uncharacterized protein n=1 Tax=Chlamydomonas schloesseri TaxID=2026947 RepID=A0A835WSK1_9CHLO|nr:hypothetical protein HYH02_003591 [Chlamydomonas schloesseri]|eukprot:KAG2451815.1 hypothetical protein HYH02_003591 [Chlamydomonas schloesseri]